MTREQKLEAALREFLEITAPAVRIPHEDPHYGDEVRALGDRIGYGAMMVSAQAAWRAVLQRNGHEGGEHTHGPAYLVLLSARAMAEDALKNP